MPFQLFTIISRQMALFAAICFRRFLLLCYMPPSPSLIIDAAMLMPPPRWFLCCLFADYWLLRWCFFRCLTPCFHDYMLWWCLLAALFFSAMLRARISRHNFHFCHWYHFIFRCFSPFTYCWYHFFDVLLRFRRRLPSIDIDHAAAPFLRRHFRHAIFRFFATHADVDFSPHIISPEGHSSYAVDYYADAAAPISQMPFRHDAAAFMILRDMMPLFCWCPPRGAAARHYMRRYALYDYARAYARAMRCRRVYATPLFITFVAIIFYAITFFNSFSCFLCFLRCFTFHAMLFSFSIATFVYLMLRFLLLWCRHCHTLRFHCHDLSPLPSSICRFILSSSFMPIYYLCHFHYLLFSIYDFIITLRFLFIIIIFIISPFIDYFLIFAEMMLFAFDCWCWCFFFFISLHFSHYFISIIFRLFRLHLLMLIRHFSPDFRLRRRWFFISFIIYFHWYFLSFHFHFLMPSPPWLRWYFTFLRRLFWCWYCWLYYIDITCLYFHLFRCCLLLYISFASFLLFVWCWLFWCHASPWLMPFRWFSSAAAAFSDWYSLRFFIFFHVDIFFAFLFCFWCLMFSDWLLSLLIISLLMMRWCFYDFDDADYLLYFSLPYLISIFDWHLFHWLFSFIISLFFYLFICYFIIFLSDYCFRFHYLFHECWNVDTRLYQYTHHMRFFTPFLRFRVSAMPFSPFSCRWLSFRLMRFDDTPHVYAMPLLIPHACARACAA